MVAGKNHLFLFAIESLFRLKNRLKAPLEELYIEKSPLYTSNILREADFIK